MFMYTDYNQHLLDNVKKIHFIGCGGSGMYPLIQILAAKGYEISGSDVLDGSIIRYEREMGVKVSLGHSADNIIGVDMVVYSAAISKDTSLMPSSPMAMPAGSVAASSRPVLTIRTKPRSTSAMTFIMMTKRGRWLQPTTSRRWPKRAKPSTSYSMVRAQSTASKKRLSRNWD